MAIARNAFLVVVLLVASLLSTTAGAQPVNQMPRGFLHEIPYFAVDLMPGDVVDVGFWIEILDTRSATLEYTGEFGAVSVSRTDTLSGRSFNVVSAPLTAEAIMGECNGGQIFVADRILQLDDFGEFSNVITKASGFAPCNWADDEVTPTVPIQLEVCGDNNDVIQIGRQSRGLSWNEGVWAGNSRTVTFTADTGFTVVGQETFTFVDSGNCIVGPVDPPVQTYVCGPNNDTFVFAPQPPNVIMAMDSTWRGGQRTIYFVADAGYTLDGPGEFVFTDQPNRMCASPRRTPPVVINTPPARPALPVVPVRPTPRGFPRPIITIVPTDISNTQPPVTEPPGEKTSAPALPTELAVGAGSNRAGEAAVITLAPLAVLLGAIAVRIRRHDE